MPTAITEIPSGEWQQYLALGVLSLAAAGATGILSLSQRNFFQPYFGRINPMLAIVLTMVLSFVSLGFLYSHGWFEIYGAQKTLREIGRASCRERVSLEV
jgi:hypothetical protein